jgi:transposase-like protein
MPAPNRSPFNRPRWTEHDARAALVALERSGKAVRAFAEEHGLDPRRLYAWRRRVGGDSTMFRELVVRPSSSVACEGGI